MNSSSSSFNNYFDFKSSIKSIKGHQILAINRGEKKKELKVTLDIPDENFEKKLGYFCTDLVGNGSHKKLIFEAMQEAYKRLVKPKMKRKIRANLTKMAEHSALNVFAENLRQLLLTFPCRHSVVMGLDPGFKNGCKLAVINEHGKVLKTNTFYPKFDGSLAEKDEQMLRNYVEEYKVDVIGIGNGSGFGHTQKIVANLIKKFKWHKVSFTRVNEDGASIYRYHFQAH